MSQNPPAKQGSISPATIPDEPRFLVSLTFEVHARTDIQIWRSPGGGSVGLIDSEGRIYRPVACFERETPEAKGKAPVYEDFGEGFLPRLGIEVRDYTAREVQALG